MYKNPEYELQVAQERYHFIREDFLRNRSERQAGAARLHRLARHTGRLLIHLGMRLVRYSQAGTPAAAQVHSLRSA